MTDKPPSEERRVPRPPKPTRVATTAIASVLLVLGGAGLLLSGWGLLFLSAVEPSSMDYNLPVGVLKIDALLQVLGKIGLLAVAVLLLRRHPLARASAYAALAISMTGSLYSVLVVLPKQVALMDTAAGAFGYYAGSLGMAGAALLLYTGVILYLRTPASRAEFGVKFGVRH